MNNAILYLLTVLIWGTTWFAVKIQIEHAPPEVSILYRLTLAAICLIILCKIKKLSLRFSFRDHIFLCGLGISMFALENLFVYGATTYIVSGVVAVVFSAVSFLNVVNAYIFFRTKPTVNVCLGAVFGIVGLCAFFWDEFAHVNSQDKILIGLGLAGIGTFAFSLGTSIGQRNHKKGLSMLPTLGISMAYGAIAVFIYTLIYSHELVLPQSPSYWWALLYLVTLGSVVAFLCYFKLLTDLGPELAGYSAVMFPVVALLVSSFMEGYQWTWLDIVGFVLVILGNVLVMSKKPLKELVVPKFLRKARS